MSIKKKHDCKLIGEDGNIFNLIGIASRTLRQNGMPEQAVEMRDRMSVVHATTTAVNLTRSVARATGK